MVKRTKRQLIVVKEIKRLEQRDVLLCFQIEIH